MSSSDDWSEIEDSLRERRSTWEDDHIEAQMQYYKDFDKQHPKCNGWVEDCDWRKELSNDIPDFPSFKDWRKLKGITLKGIDCIKKCVECVEEMVEEAEKAEILHKDEEDGKQIQEDQPIDEEVNITEVIEISSDYNKE